MFLVTAAELNVSPINLKILASIVLNFHFHTKLPHLMTE